MIKNIQIKKFPLDKPGPARYTLCQKVRFRAGCDSPLAVRKLLSLPKCAKGTKKFIRRARAMRDLQVRDHLLWVLTRCDSGTNGIVRMQETAGKLLSTRPVAVFFVAAGRFSVCPSRSKIRNCFYEQGVPNDKDAQTVCNAYGNSFCDTKRAFGTFLQGLLPGKES